MVIYDVDGSDSGEWKCVAENEVGSAEESEEIFVQTIPDIIQVKQVEKVTEFETLSLHCKLADAHNQPVQISWWLDGKPIEDEIDSTRLMYSEERTKLTIQKLKYLESGVYSCIVLGEHNLCACKFQ